MRVLIDRKDFLGIEELVEEHNIRDDLKELILDFPNYSVQQMLLTGWKSIL